MEVSNFCYLEQVANDVVSPGPLQVRQFSPRRILLFVGGLQMPPNRHGQVTNSHLWVMDKRRALFATQKFGVR